MLNVHISQLPDNSFHDYNQLNGDWIAFMSSLADIFKAKAQINCMIKEFWLGLGFWLLGNDYDSFISLI